MSEAAGPRGWVWGPGFTTVQAAWLTTCPVARGGQELPAPIPAPIPARALRRWERGRDRQARTRSPGQRGEREGRVSSTRPPGRNGQADACGASSWKRSLQAILGKVLLGRPDLGTLGPQTPGLYDTPISHRVPGGNPAPKWDQRTPGSPQPGGCSRHQAQAPCGPAPGTASAEVSYTRGPHAQPLLPLPVPKGRSPAPDSPAAPRQAAAAFSGGPPRRGDGPLHKQAPRTPGHRGVTCVSEEK